MLDETIAYLNNRRKNGQFTYEVIVVDDGSGDETSNVSLRKCAGDNCTFLKQ